jgi:DNA-binding PadR family transcriptional regulator
MDSREFAMEILQGTLDLTRGAFVIKPGALFPALRRVEQKGWIDGDWGPSEISTRFHKAAQPPQ